MANPQPDKFIKLSNELYDAIMTSDFSKRQRNILDMIIRFSYGCRKKTALLRNSDFEQCGVGRNKIKAELEYLEQAKVIIRDGELIQLNKNYDQWRVNLVKTFNKQKFNEILKRNLSIPETGTPIPEMGTEEIDSSQNGNSTVPETGTGMPPNSRNDKGFERPKDILNTFNNDDDDDIYRSPELEENSNQKRDKRLEKIKTHFSKKAQKIWYSHEEDMAMIQLLDEGIPVKTIIDGIDLAFERFKPKHSRDRINSFRYCLSAIYELHERGVNHESSSQRGNSKNSGYPEISQGYYDQFDIFAN
jgi:Bacteriophage replication protein O